MASGPIYGLDAELKAKRDARYSVEDEQAVTEWIEAVTGQHRGDASFAAWLQSGEVLCNLANAVKPGSVKRINKQRMPFMQMENIKAFLQAARSLGLTEYDCFCTPDLYEEKDLGAVVRSLLSYAGKASNLPNWNKPKLGVKASTKNQREGATWKGRAPGANGEVSRLNMGSYGIMQQGDAVTAREVYGANKAGAGDAGSVSQRSMGSAGVMQQGDTAVAREVYGAVHGGASSSTPTQRSMGSAGVMRVPNQRDTRDVTFGAKAGAGQLR